MAGCSRNGWWTLSLGQHTAEDRTPVRTVDFKQLSKQVGDSIIGILGMDCLRHYCLQLDFAAGKMRFLDPKQLDVSQLGKPFPLNLSRYSQLFINSAGLTGRRGK